MTILNSYVDFSCIYGLRRLLYCYCSCFGVFLFGDTTGSAQGLLLALYTGITHEGPFGMLGLKPGLGLYKVNSLFPVLSL